MRPTALFNGNVKGFIFVLERFLFESTQTANIMSCTRKIFHVQLGAIPGRTIVLLLKIMARRASSVRTLQTYQSGNPPTN